MYSWSCLRSGNALDDASRSVLWKSGLQYIKLVSDCLSDAVLFFITMFKSQSLKKIQSRNLEGYGRKETTFETFCETEGPEKYKVICSNLEINSSPFLSNKCCCSWNNTDCRHICSFLSYREAKVFWERSSYINLLWSASCNHDNLFQKLVIIENTISKQSTKHIYKNPFRYTSIANMPLSHLLFHQGGLAVISTHFSWSPAF